MNDTQKMLQAIINGQSALKQELAGKIDKVDQKVDRLGEKVEGLDGKIDSVEKNLTQRLDKIGKQLAYLEDDAPTRDEYDIHPMPGMGWLDMPGKTLLALVNTFRTYEG